MDISWFFIDLYIFAMWTIGVSAFVFVLYALGYFIYRFLTRNKLHKFITIKKSLVLLVIIIIANIFFFRQQFYIEQSHANPIYYPCQRIYCLDNYFPKKTSQPKPDLSKINFDVYLASPPAEYKLKYADIYDPAPISRMAQGQPIYSFSYWKGDEAIDVIETVNTPAMQASLQTFDSHAQTSGGRVVYLGGNTVSASVIGNTVIYTDDGYAYSAYPLFDSFYKVSLNNVPYKPYTH